ncbi:uncharacterized protein N7496_006116 [Penicillium cataractarum]|uniref:Uncharacterized protein n=1 Tax=Penicillium cataractarum TaxID=2100454 RepID=A0A9W9S3N5_9EURO|nr:uncharacterized protein N7496_006116 [Penicillium cataractarum]KAJ5370024.1 hypothetical protein N7496_006116 [Penicillium cataractarum]
MVQTRQQARPRTQPDNKKANSNARVRKSRQVPTRVNLGGPQRRTELTSEVVSLLNKDAPEEDFRIALARSEVKLDFFPPLMFDNLYKEDAFYKALQKRRLDVLPLMLGKQELEMWNILHLAVVYDSLEVVKEVRNKIPDLGCVVDQRGRTPLHLAFTKCNTLVAQFLLENDCWKKYNGADRDCLGHLAVEAIAFDCRKSGMCAWARFVGWLYDPQEGGMVIDTQDSNGETAIDLARKWDIYDVRVKYTLMGRK